MTELRALGLCFSFLFPKHCEFQETKVLELQQAQASRDTGFPGPPTSGDVIRGPREAPSPCPPCRDFFPWCPRTRG